MFKYFIGNKFKYCVEFEPFFDMRQNRLWQKNADPQAKRNRDQVIECK